MTIALLGIANIYNGFQKFMATALHFENEDNGKACRSASTSVSISIQPTAFKPSPRALRVLRVSEQGEASSCAGRMVISGKMADVCAELDRLVALESQNKPSLHH